MTRPTDPRGAFLHDAIWHGNLTSAKALLAEHPELGSSDIHVAAVLGDGAAVRRLLAQDPGLVRAEAPPYGGEPLVYLCLSKYLRLEPARSEAFLDAATALLDAGANPKSGFWNEGEFETALYGAAGVAHHPGLTRLLLERGADPTDVEVLYHSPEGHDSRAMQLVVETGKLSGEQLRLMLIRKIDWHDVEGVRWLLEHGTTFARDREKWPAPLEHAIDRGNGIDSIKLLLDHGADPLAVEDGLTAVQRAARKGRGDILAELERRKVPIELEGLDRLLAACARDDVAQVQSLKTEAPGLVTQLLAEGGKRLGEFAIAGNTAGVVQLLDLGVPVDARYPGYGYFSIAKDSTALHISAWMLDTDTLKLLLQRGAAVNVKDANSKTPLAMVLKGCTESYWTEWRSLEPIQALLDAGATLDSVKLPSGYKEADDLLKERMP